MERSSKNLTTKLARISLQASFAFDNPRFSDYRLEVTVRPPVELPESDTHPECSSGAHCPGDPEAKLSAEQLQGSLQDCDNRSCNGDGNLLESSCTWETTVDGTDMVTDQPSVTLHVNSAILAGQSSYFERLFSNDMCEYKDKLITIVVDDEQELAAVVSLLRFMHYGTIPDSCTNASVEAILKLLVAADRFGVLDAATACAAHLAELPLDFSTFTTFFHLPEPLWSNESELVSTVASFLESHFKSYDAILLCPTLKEQFLSLPLMAVQIMLTNSKVACFYENTVFIILEEWLFHNGITSSRHMNEAHMELLRAIRYPYITSLFAVDFVKRSPLLQSIDAQHLIVDGLASRCFYYQCNYQQMPRTHNTTTPACSTVPFPSNLPVNPRPPRPLTDIQWVLSTLPTPESRAIARFSLNQPCLAKHFVFNLSSLRDLALGNYHLHEQRLIAFGYSFTVGISRMAAESTMCYGTNLPKEVAQLVWYYEGDERVCVDCMLMVRCHCGFGEAPHVCSLQYPSSINCRGIMGRMVMPVEAGHTVMGWHNFLTSGHEYEKDGSVHVTLAVKLLNEECGTAAVAAPLAVATGFAL